MLILDVETGRFDLVIERWSRGVPFTFMYTKGPKSEIIMDVGRFRVIFLRKTRRRRWYVGGVREE